MNILCVAAHQDDIELNCLGAMILYRKAGNPVTHLVLTNGDKGGQFDPDLPYDAVAKIRDAEAGDLAARLGARYICLHEPDEYLVYGERIVNLVADAIREANADIVFAPPPSDYSMDHTEASRIAFQAAMLAPIKTIHTEHEPTNGFPALFYMEALGALDWQPTHFVDISGVFDVKCELLKCHESQMKHMSSSSGWNLIDYAGIVGRFRGLQCGVKYAESFRTAGGWPRVSPNNRLLP